MIDCDSQTCNGCYWYDADTGVCSKTESSPEIEGIKEYCRKEGGKNMDKKICPILSSYIWQGAGHADTGLHDVECREEKCAWWDDERGKCAIFVIANGIARLDEEGIVIFDAQKQRIADND